METHEKHSSDVPLGPFLPSLCSGNGEFPAGKMVVESFSSQMSVTLERREIGCNSSFSTSCEPKATSCFIIALTEGRDLSSC